jgi:predicted SnoaL-like aldol condensation-catalyzing enzyme
MRPVDGVSDLNKRKILLFIEAVWNEGRLELIDELVAADYAGHVSPARRRVCGPDGMRSLVTSCRRKHPNMHVKTQDHIAEEDRVAVRWQATIVQPQDPSAERTVCCSGITIVRLLAGKQVDSHTELQPSQASDWTLRQSGQ